MFDTDPSFVLADLYAAFRVAEWLFGIDLNGDGDMDDAVMHVLDLGNEDLFNTGYAAIPCPTEPCDPSESCKIAGDKVRFLTLEPEQANSPTGCPIPGPICDLDGDGLGTDLILQTFNIEMAKAQLSAAGATKVVASTVTGVCTDTGEACADDAQCSRAASASSRQASACATWARPATRGPTRIRATSVRSGSSASPRPRRRARVT